MSDLHVTRLGDHGSPVVLCHGLFGQGRNWTQIGKALGHDHRVTLVDMPNHGRSGWTERIDYAEMADAIAGLLEEPTALVGHSMGGKVAMLVALRHPGLVSRLCVVDVAPVAYRASDEFAGFIDAMLAIDLASLTSRADADAALADAVPDPGVRAFLLQSLRRDDAGWAWMSNLEVLRRDLGVIRDWPATEGSFDGPVLWIAGGDSRYVRDEHRAAMEALFPRVRRATVKGAGHWVHSQEPAIVTELLTRFLAD
ncbi:alpha/beta fold hydrolase [Agrococcus sp. SGAir0287]|uniref:alpha/beta fold hydrolase n=1 Tax=Agrococcus sp. SGAir0287 TaxID=2070347 RepID=UPI0015864453|nr:alpha/beta fold hydrolase [Agrococcus sp. SGAir0287]